MALLIKLTWDNPKHVVLKVGGRRRINSRPASESKRKGERYDLEARRVQSLTSVELGAPAGTTTDDLGQPSYHFSDEQSEKMQTEPKGQKLRLSVEFKLVVHAASDAARAQLGGESLEILLLRLDQLFEVDVGRATVRALTHGRSSTTDASVKRVNGLHPLLRLSVEKNGTVRAHVTTQFLDVTPVFRRFVKWWSADSFDEDAQRCGYVWRMLLYTGRGMRDIARDDNQAEDEHWLWCAVVPKRLALPENDGAQVGALLHFQPFNDEDYRSIVDEHNGWDLEHGVSSQRVPASFRSLREATQAERFMLPWFSRRANGTIFDSLRADFGRLVAKADEPWVLLWPIPKGTSPLPQHGPACAAGAWSRVEEAMSFLQGTATLASAAPSLTVAPFALSAFSSGGQSMNRALENNHGTANARSKLVVNGLLVMDTSSKNWDRERGMQTWAAKWAERYSGKIYALLVWGINGGAMSSLKLRWSQTNGCRADYRPRAASFWKESPWWTECWQKFVKTQPHPHQFAFFGGEGKRDDPASRHWLEIFFEGMKQVDRSQEK